MASAAVAAQLRASALSPHPAPSLSCGRACFRFNLLVHVPSWQGWEIKETREYRLVLIFHTEPADALQHKPAREYLGH